MKDAYRMVEEFMRAFEQETPDKPCIPSLDVLLLRRRMIREENDEYVNAVINRDIVAVADALADLSYVVIGTAAAHGLVRFPEIFSETHRSNMAKLGPDGKPLRRKDGKILKPKNWTPPRLEEFLK